MVLFLTKLFYDTASMRFTTYLLFTIGTMHAEKFAGNRSGANDNAPSALFVQAVA